MFSAERDELGEGLRDVAVVVGTDSLLPFIVEGLTTSIAASAAAGLGLYTAIPVYP